jgi:hypothetical protein
MGGGVPPVARAGSTEALVVGSGTPVSVSGAAVAAVVSAGTPLVGAVEGGPLPPLPPLQAAALPAAPPVAAPNLADVMLLCTLHVELGLGQGGGLGEAGLVAFVASHGHLCHLDRLLAACVEARCAPAVAAVLVRV